MDFRLTTEQDLLKRSAREFLGAKCKLEFRRAMDSDECGCPVDLWREIAELGWTALPFPEQYGGAGGSIVDLAVLLEEMGRVTLPGPFFTTVVLGGLTILEAGPEEQRKRLLPGVASGELITTLAILEQSLTYDPSGVRMMARRSRSGYEIGGTKLFVPDVHLADYIICVARTSERTAGNEGLSLFLVEANGGKTRDLDCARLETLGGDKQFEVGFDAVPVSDEAVLGELDSGWVALRKVLEVAAVAKCAELLGGAQRVLELALDQSHNRIQFGRPIGSFQAIQHHCANMAVDIELCRLVTYEAAWLLSEGKESTKQVSVAKAFVGDAYARIVSLGHQVLGGNGLIDEHEMPLFSKRALTGQQCFGSPDYHREMVVRQLGL